MTCCKCEHPIDITNYVENYDEPVSDGAITYTVTDTGERQYHLGSNAYANAINHCPYCGESLAQEKDDNPDLNKYTMHLIVGAEKRSNSISSHISLKDKYQNFKDVIGDSVALSTIAATEGISYTTNIVTINAKNHSKHEVQKIKRLATSDTLSSVLRNLGFHKNDIDQIVAVINNAHVELNDRELALVNEGKEK